MTIRFRLVSLFVLITSFVIAAPRAVAQDCDSNGIADADELSLRDCNRNGVIDACDLSAQTSPDCNGNGLPDECDVFAPCAMEPSGFAGGDGTPENPYLVCTPAQLDHVRNHLDAHFRQIADIDMANFGLIYQANFQPIGSQLSPFIGSFDGDGFDIRDLVVTNLPNQNQPVGLFGVCGGGAELVRVNLVGAQVLISSVPIPVPAGILVGELQGTAVIQRCTVSGEVSGTFGSQFAGGLVGYFSGSGFIVASSSNSLVAGSLSGGLVGKMDGGGLIGDCFASGAAGAGGANWGPSGGLVGEIVNGSLATCYSTTAVLAPSLSGGLVKSVGESAGPFIDCYWDVDASNAPTSAVGLGLTTIQMKSASSYSTSWNFETLWQIDDGVDYPKLRRAANTGTEFDCNGNNVPDSCELAAMTAGDCNGNGILDECDLAQPCMTLESGFAGGSGSTISPYQICSPEQLQHVRDFAFSNSNFLQTAHIDMTGMESFSPLSFRGFYDGGGYEVRNISMPPDSATGLFGFVEYSAIVDVHLVNSSVSKSLGIGSPQLSAGVLAASINESFLDSCSVAGNLEGDYLRAGLLSGLMVQSTIRRCSAEGRIAGAVFAGGLVGYGVSNVHVYDCYSTASVAVVNGYDSEGQRFGGLFGEASLSGVIEHCYTAGSVDGPSEEAGGLYWRRCGPYHQDNFWDVDVSGQTETCDGLLGGSGNYGLTTAEMQTQSTYEPEWDFENVWTIDEGNDYPRLRPYRRFVLGTETDDNGNGLIDSCDVGGDLDGDGAVTVADIPLFVNVLLTNGNGTLTDLNRDYRTNADDLPLFLAALVGTP